MSAVLLDAVPAHLVNEAVLRTGREKARRVPIHMVHRWWSRRFASIYRLILASYLLEREEEALEALDQPAAMRERARGRVFFEPFAGGGTGLAEAALAGFDVYGLDVNPVAVVAAKASLLIAARGLPEGFRELSKRVLSATKEKVSFLWGFDGKLVTYILVTRDRAPTWVSSLRGRRVALCPRCFAVFEVSTSSAAVCPFCGSEVELTSKPAVAVPSSAPEVAPGWRAFAVELRWRENGRWERGYQSVTHSAPLAAWLSDAARTARELAQGLDELLGEVGGVHESFRLRGAGIQKASEVFAPHQLATFFAYAEAARSLAGGDDERLLLLAAASEAAKCCCLLAKWYPPLGECTPASGVKALWVPEFTAITNPVASDGLRPLARGTLASALRAQLKAMSYVERAGGPSGVFSTVVVGDALEAPFPRRADLVVLDPPYGKVKSYASLSLPHFYSLKAVGGLAGSEQFQSLELIEKRELSPEKDGFQEEWNFIIRRISSIVDEGSRVVLMFNALSRGRWAAILEPFRINGFQPTAIYWVLGEAPRGITASKLRGMHLIVFRKGGAQSGLHVVQTEPLNLADKYFNLDEKIERRACKTLLAALKEIFAL
jgi:hypothetical protein